MRKLNKLISALVIILQSNACLWAADISLKKMQQPPDLIIIKGDFQGGDEKRFSNIALTSNQALVVLESLGGSLSAGLEIGKIIRIKGTYIRG